MNPLNVYREAGQLRLVTPHGSWVMPDTSSNQKMALIWLRSWRKENGKPQYTFEAIAHAFGYPDRRNVHNYWQEFVACGQDTLAFLQRQRKVDEVVVEAVGLELQACFWSSLQELRERVNQRLGRQDLSEANVETALEQLPVTLLRREVLRHWEAGKFHPKESFILEQVLCALQEGQSPKMQQAQELLEQSGIVAPPAAEWPIQKQQRQAVEDLLTSGKAPEALAPRIQLMAIALSLYYWNVPLSRLALWMGVGKSTVYGWVIGLALALWENLGGWVHTQVQGTRIFVDEKWLKIRGKWHYWFVALDEQTGIPLAAQLLPTQSQWACCWFLLKLRRLGHFPQTIMTDGLAGYLGAIPKVFAKAKHLACLFHHQQGVTRWVQKHLSHLSQEQQQTAQREMKAVVQTTDSRTVERRLQALEKKEQQRQWGMGAWIEQTKTRLPRLLPALRNNAYPRTNNPIERFFRTFERFYKTRAGFHSVKSATQELILFWVVYLFTIQESGHAPIEKIWPQAATTPLYRLLNSPLEFMAVLSRTAWTLGALATPPLAARALGS